MHEVLNRAHRHAIEYLSSLRDRPVPPAASLQEMRSALLVPLSEEGEDDVAVLDALVSSAGPGIMANAGGRFFGFVIGGALPVALAADWMTSAWDQNAGIYVLSPAEAVAEEAAAAWILDLLKLPSGASVGFVTGAQMANFTALAAAREEVLRRVGWNVNEDGLTGAPQIDVVVGEEVHVTVLRALRYLGIGTGRVRSVAADEQGRLRPDELRKMIRGSSSPLIVCAQAGNVNSGAIDPVGEIAEIVHSSGGWLHVDGAFGLWAATVPELEPMLSGISLADSWATDAHKWLNVPQDCGIVIVANPAAHKAAVSTDAEYLIRTAGAERDALDWVPEFSRRGRGFPVYAALRHLGRRGICELVRRCCAHARTFAERLSKEAGIEVLNEVTLNQVLVRFVPSSGDPDDFTRRVIERIQREGTCWLGGSRWKGSGVMRISVANWSTTAEDVERSIEAIIRCYREELAHRQ